MITDLILMFFSLLYKFIIAILPAFDFITNMYNAKEEFITFITPIMQHVLYIYNVPILRLAVSILLLYINALFIEYTIKLNLKYVSRVV